MLAAVMLDVTPLTKHLFCVMIACIAPLISIHNTLEFVGLPEADLSPHIPPVILASDCQLLVYKCQMVAECTCPFITVMVFANSAGRNLFVGQK